VCCFSLPEGTNLPSGVTATDVTQLGDNFGGGAGTQPRRYSPKAHTANTRGSFDNEADLYILSAPTILCFHRSLAAVEAVLAVLSLSWKGASVEAVNAIAYATRYHPE